MDDNLLSTEQILLLENLTYLLDRDGLQSLETMEEDLPPEGDFTVEYVVEQLKKVELEDDKDYGSYMTGKDWKNILQAVVAFRETAEYEWKDNFLAGASTDA